MKVEQVYSILNTITNEMLGDSIIVNEDLSNVVEIGKAFSNLENGLDNYVRKLQDHIGRVVYVDRVYSGRAPKLIRDAWEYGSILEKIRCKMPEATEMEDFELENGVSYDPNVFTAPEVTASFWDKRVVFEIPISITEKQVKSSFSSATQLNAFYSMIRTAIENSLTVKMDGLIMRTINAAIAETFHSDFPSDTGYSSGSGVRAINLLYKYNNEVLAAGATPLTVDTAMYSPEFIRFCAYQIGLYADRLSVLSTLFNIEGTEKFTPRDRMHIVMLSEFKRKADVYLQSDTFHDEFTKLPDAEPVTFWQGSGTAYDFDDTSAINIKTPNGNTVSVKGVLCTMFDSDAMGVANLDRRVTTNYNPKAEFFNEWHKYFAGHWLDLSENIICFYVA